MPNDDYSNFEQLMSDIPKGKIEDDDKISSEIENMLSKVWTFYDGAFEGGMRPDKLHGRMEKIEWDPPILRFVIERHGGTVMGSVYAELQSWEVNINERTASVAGGQRRIVGKREPRLDIDSCVAEVVELITKGYDDDRLKWSNGNQRVQVQIGKIVPSEGIAKQTLEGRRKKFSERLRDGLALSGWQKVPGAHHRYEKPFDDT